MRVLVPMANGFEDIEAAAIIDVLRRAGITVDVVGVPSTFLTSKSGVRVTADKKFDDVKLEDYDGIVIPGGENNVKALMNYLPLLAAIESFNNKKKLVAAICAAPLILSKLGLLRDKKATIYPGLERELSYPRPDKVVVDGKIITSQGPGTAIEFALKIVEVLVGSKKADDIRKSLVA